jgi:hypothetical protein
MTRRFLLLVLCTLGLLLYGCSSGPTKSAAEQQYEFARAHLGRMEYDAALKSIDQMVQAAGGGPLAQEGRVLLVVLQAGMAEGAKEMADAYQQGFLQPAGQARQRDFVGMRSSYYGMARVYLLDALEALMKQRSALGKEPLQVQFRFPDYTGTAPAALARIRSGTWVEESERFSAQKEATRNAFARTVARAAGAGDDLSKGHALFEASPQFDPRMYLIALSEQLLRVSEIFEPRGINEPRYRRISFEVIRDNMDLALKLLETAPDEELAKRVKKIREDCEKGLKRIPPG